MVALCWRPVSGCTPCEKVRKVRIEELRCELAALVGLWPAVICTCTEKLLHACNCEAELVSVFGVSDDGGTLMVLGSCGSEATAAAPGRVFPSPWKPAGAGAAYLGSKFLKSATSESKAFSQSTPMKLAWKSGSELVLPYEWHQILGHMRFSETMVLKANLEPLVLNRRLVGALLVVSYAGALPQYRNSREVVTTAPFVSPITWMGGERSDSPPATPKASPPSLLRRLKMRKGAGSETRAGPAAPSPEMMRDLASALAQAALAPRLQPVLRVCSAAQAIASALTLTEFASVLSYTVTEALATELHVNLAVRVAVVPPTYGQYGYLLPLDTTAIEVASNGDSYVRRATSGALNNITPPRMPSIIRTLSGRGLSFSGQSHASAPNNIVSAPSGGKTDGKAFPFALPSSLLLQLLRPAGNRTGNASVHGSVYAGSSVAYYPEEPTVRSIVTRTAPPQVLEAVVQHNGDVVQAQDAQSVCSAQAATAALHMHPSSCSVSGAAFAAARAGGGGTSGMVIANLNAWMQDVEKPSSDVAQLLMSKSRAMAVPPGRMSFGGSGGIAATVPGPACLVVVAGSAHRGGAAAPAMAAAAVAATSGSVRVSKAGVAIEDWVKSLEASMRGGVAVDMSFRAGGYGGGGGGGYGSVYGGGSVRYDGGVSCGPCVALYITALERLPTSLLRAVKDRSQALLELLLPSCLTSLSMGPVRADLEALAQLATYVSAGNAGPQGGQSSSRRNLQAPTAAAPSSVGCPSVGGGPTSLTSSHISGSQLKMPSPPSSVTEEPTAAALPLRFSNALGFNGGGGGGACFPSSPRARSGRAGGGGSGSAPLVSGKTRGADDGGNSGHSSGPSCMLGPVDGMSPIRSADVGGSGAPGGNSAAAGGSGGGSRRQDDLFLLAQQKWPDRPTACLSADRTASAAVVASPLPSSGAGSGLTTTGGQRSPLAAHLSSQSRTTRGTQGSGESFGFGAMGMGSIMASMEVMSGGDDLVSSMRDNLDVWVNSFWGMLREPIPNGGGNTSGSYADDDLRFLRLYSRLGAGGAASVYAGMLLGMDVAVKVIEPPPDITEAALAVAHQSVGGLSAAAGDCGGANSGGGMHDGDEEDEAERVAALTAALRQAQMRELIRSARECAVLTTLSHPAIVQVYSYHTRVQVVPGDGPEGLPRLLPVPPGEPADTLGPLHSVLIMERCDLGSLADALDGGMFKKAILAAANAAISSAGCAVSSLRSTRSYSNAPQGLGRVEGGGNGAGGTFSFGSPAYGGGAMRAIYLTLLEVALALRHLHSKNLVHCDIKVANILLKSSSSDPRGFTCKLSDFGLINLLQHDEDEEGGGDANGGEERQQQDGPPRSGGVHKAWMRNADVAGTVTHLAPECFTPGARLDESVDIYAFGIVMWEVFMRKAPYAEFAPDFEDLPARVAAGLRPRFSAHCPAPFKALAQACWCGEASRRPTAASIVTCLQQLLEGGTPYRRSAY